MPPLTQRLSPARRVAHNVLVRVARDRAYADRALDAALQRNSMSSRDRSLATQLVYGPLRNQQRLDFYLARLSNRPLRKIAPPIIVALRMGAYEILDLRTPDHSAVHQSVSLVGKKHRYAKGFVNAVLRKLAALKETEDLPKPEDKIKDPVQRLAVMGSHPEWLVRRLVDELGDIETRLLIETNNKVPPIFLRINQRRTTREELLRLLIEAGIDAQASQRFPQAIELTSAGNIRELPGFSDGLFVVQDPAAQMVTELLEPQEGQVVLDMCAAPGGKSTHIAERVGDSGKVLATDIHPGRTGLVQKNAQRLGMQDVIQTMAIDGTDPKDVAQWLYDLKLQQVDQVLIDAPCSGMGTLRRNPELRARLEAEIPSLCHIQDKLIDTAVEVLKPGGTLVYAVCTITAEEGVERVTEALKRHPALSVEKPSDALAELSVNEPIPSLRTWPQLHGCDGFFAAKLRKAE